MKNTGWYPMTTDKAGMTLRTINIDAPEYRRNRTKIELLETDEGGMSEYYSDAINEHRDRGKRQSPPLYEKERGGSLR